MLDAMQARPERHHGELPGHNYRSQARFREEEGDHGFLK
jgi:hypothetical protein